MRKSSSYVLLTAYYSKFLTFYSIAISGGSRGARETMVPLGFPYEFNFNNIKSLQISKVAPLTFSSFLYPCKFIVHNILIAM